MKKKIVSMLLVAAMVASMAVGCGSKNDSGNSDTKSDKGESITFMAPDWAIPSDDQLDEFTKETGIEVEVSEVGWDDIREKLATAATGNKNVADVVEVDWSWVGEFKAAGWLEPLKISDADKEDFLTLDTFTVDDEILALPYSNDYRIAYYNKDQFAKAGINEAPKTYAEVLEDAKALKAATPIGKGLAASPGAACGRIVFTAEDAKEWANKGEKVILVRLETSPEDIEGMSAAQGILTVRGGMTSHAAVVARGMGTCCVSGCGEITVDYEAKQFTLGGKAYHEGDYISLDGSTGAVYGQALPTVEASISGDFSRFMQWADSARRLKVYANADNPHDAKQARSFGAEGIGLCRTEHMFFEADRIKAMREMIVATTTQERKEALEKLLPYQQKDFEGIYQAMEGAPVVIRFLDPPLHEFLPTKEEDILQIAEELHVTIAHLKDVIASLHEFNPMMGHRGCRLAVSYPEIAQMQTKAVIQAAIAVMKQNPNIHITPEIMIPLVGEEKELKFVKDIVTTTADQLIADSGIEMTYLVGTMIEVPRAALTADKIAKEAEFFSFGTNDLTQMTFGFSRDDAGKFLNDYYEHKIFEFDPFAKLDQTGVGQLVELAAKLARITRPDISLGICGEHGGDPSSVEFFHKVGLNYVSCSPFRVPIARLAAAQAAIRNP